MLSVVGTAANVADVTQVDKLLHGAENVVCADAGCTGVEKCTEHEGREVIWQVAARRSTYKKLGKRSALYKAKRKIEKANAQVRAKVEHLFRVIKRQFCYVKTRFRGLAKNTAQLGTLFGLRLTFRVMVLCIAGYCGSRNAGRRPLMVRAVYGQKRSRRGNSIDEVDFAIR